MLYIIDSERSDECIGLTRIFDFMNYLINFYV